jgi:hypothetical protein
MMYVFVIIFYAIVDSINMLNIYVIKFACDLWQVGGFLRVFLRQ